MTQTNRTILSTAARDKARVLKLEALVRTLLEAVEWQRYDYADDMRYCSECGQRAEKWTQIDHAKWCVVGCALRHLAADDAGIAPDDTSEVNG